MHRVALRAQHYPVLAAALPLAGWAIHTTHLTRKLDAARRDPLTGALTRDGFTVRAERILAHPEGVLVFVDLDKFKQANDTFGHAAGDAALVHTARTLALWTGPRGIVGRFGGDEFTAALRIPGAVLADRLTRLSARLDSPTWQDTALPVTASIGAVRTVDLPTATLEAAQRAADAAMYAAKREHGGGWWTLAAPEHLHPAAPHRHRRHRDALGEVA